MAKSEVTLNLKLDMSELEDKISSLKDQIQDLIDSLDYAQSRLNELKADVAYIEGK